MVKRTTACVFCDIVAGKIAADFIYHDDKVVVFPDQRPKAAEHLLLVPKEHIASLNDVHDADQGLMGYLVCVLPKIAKMRELSGFRTIINTGVAGGQEVYHLHFHLLGGSNLPKF